MSRHAPEQPRRPPRSAHIEQRGRVAPKQESNQGENKDLSDHASDAFFNRLILLAHCGPITEATISPINDSESPSARPAPTGIAVSARQVITGALFATAITSAISVLIVLAIWAGVTLCNGWPCPSTAMRGPHRVVMLGNPYRRGSFQGFFCSCDEARRMGGSY